MSMYFEEGISIIATKKFGFITSQQNNQQQNQSFTLSSNTTTSRVNTPQNDEEKTNHHQPLSVLNHGNAIIIIDTILYFKMPSFNDIR